MAQTYAAGLARHRAEAKSTVDRRAHLKALRPDLSPAEANAVVATMTSAGVYESLTRDFGWTFDQCANWLTYALRPTAPTGPGPRLD